VRFKAKEGAMMDEWERMIQQEKAWRRTADPLGDAYNQLGLGSGTMKFLRQEEERRKILSSVGDLGAMFQAAEDMERHRKLLEGPIEEARRLGLFDPHSELRHSITATIEAQQAFEASFRRPEFAEIDRLSREALAGAEFAQRVLGEAGMLQTAMGDIHSPWLRVDAAPRSAQAFAAVVAIGRGLEAFSPFETQYAAALRLSLGDWRDLVTPAPTPLIDPIARTGFYHERGLDPALTDFTVPAFEESVRIARLDTDDAPSDEAGEDDGFARARWAFDKLRRFEVALRRFIDRVMREAFGETWMKHRLPPNMLDGWTAKREKALKAGETEQPLIDYADFSDYRAIIERRDNWKAVFQPVFGRPEDVRESLQRLYPIRIATMHARIVTLDDELLLRVEAKRVLKAMAQFP
jgi:hypothetical protein